MSETGDSENTNAGTRIFPVERKNRLRMPALESIRRGAELRPFGRCARDGRVRRARVRRVHGREYRIARRDFGAEACESLRAIGKDLSRRVIDAGLLVENAENPEKVKRYDRFRERVMFPILNQQGAVIAFGGRILGSKDDGNGPKYLNSPASAIFDKSSILYGLHLAKQAISKSGKAYIVE